MSLTELPRITDCPLEDVTDAAWEGVRNAPAGNLQGLNTGLRDQETEGGSLNEGIRGVNSGDAFLDRRAKVRIPGSPQILTLRITGNRTGHTIHADGRIVPEIRMVNGARALVRLVGWADFGREDTFYLRPTDGRRRYVPEPQPDAPELAPCPVVLGSVTNAVIVDEAGGDAVNFDVDLEAQLE